MPDVVADYVDAIESLFVGFTQGNRSILRQKNLTAVQFLVIQWAFTEGPANMTALATFLGVRPQSVTPIIDSLVRRGWIRREHDLKDRRQTLLRISPEALRLMTEFRRIHIRRLKNALRSILYLPRACYGRSSRHPARTLGFAESDTFRSSIDGPIGPSGPPHDQ